MKNKIF